MNAEPEQFVLQSGDKNVAIIILSNGKTTITQKYNLDQPIITVVADVDGVTCVDLGKATPSCNWEEIANDPTDPQFVTDFMTPHLGDAVYYMSHGSADGTHPSGIPRPAMITQIDDPGNPESTVTLSVFTPTGWFCPADVRYGLEPGCWSWGYDHVQP